jgi:hypothetical protein
LVQCTFLLASDGFLRQLTMDVFPRGSRLLSATQKSRQPPPRSGFARASACEPAAETETLVQMAVASSQELKSAEAHPRQIIAASIEHRWHLARSLFHRVSFHKRRYKAPSHRFHHKFVCAAQSQGWQVTSGPSVVLWISSQHFVSGYLREHLGIAGRSQNLRSEPTK